MSVSLQPFHKRVHMRRGDDPLEARSLLTV